MSRLSVRLLLPAVVLFTPISMTLAQDSPPGAKAPASPPSSAAKTTIWQRSSHKVRVQTIKAQLGDIEAKRTADDAEGIRRRAACWLTAADEIDKAAKQLDQATTPAQRELALDAADAAHDLGDQCENGPDETSEAEPPEARTRLSGVSVSAGPSAFDRVLLTTLLEERQEELRGCYEEGLDRNGALKGATRFMLRLGSGDDAGTIERLRIEKDTVNDQDVLECQADVLNAIDFPAEADGRTLRFGVEHTPAPRRPTPPRRARPSDPLE